MGLIIKWKLEMEIGDGTASKKNAPITDAMFSSWTPSSVLSHYSCILLSNGYTTGVMSHVLCIKLFCAL